MKYLGGIKMGPEVGTLWKKRDLRTTSRGNYADKEARLERFTLHYCTELWCASMHFFLVSPIFQTVFPAEELQKLTI